MLPASYTRLAGVQSEISKVTITRVANSEVQYRRKINSYRKDMNVNISGIKREQVFLRRSMLRYRKQIRHHKRQKKESIQKQNESDWADSDLLKIVSAKDGGIKPTQENEEHAKENREKDQDDATDGKAGLSIDTTGEFAGRDEVHKEEDQEDVDCMELESENIGNAQELEEQITPRTFNKHGRKTLKQGRSSVRFNSLKQLPAIAEDDERENERTKQTVKNELTRRDSQFYISHLKKTKKKENVSYSDLIKLQHSSCNTRQLFKLVDKLAYNSQIEERRNKIPDIRDHIHFRGESPTLASSITKTAAVLYPIRFGYAAGSETFPEQRSAIPVSQKQNFTASLQVIADVNGSTSPRDDPAASDNDIQKIVHYGNSYDLGTATHLSNSPAKRKRLLSLPELVKEVSRIKSLEKHGRSPRDHSPTRRNSTSRPSSLTPIERAQIDRNEIRDKHNGYKVEWQSALAKIKTVHTLLNFTGF